MTHEVNLLNNILCEAIRIHDVLGFIALAAAITCMLLVIISYQLLKLYLKKQ